MSAPAGSAPERTVLLTFATVSWQKGSAAQVVSLLGALRAVRPGLRFTLLSHCPELDAQPAQGLDLALAGPRFAPRASPRRRSVQLLGARLLCVAGGLARSLPAARATARAYQDADFVLDLSGDSYRDPPGGFALAHDANFLAAHAAGVPYAVVSQSMGPFRPLNAALTRRCLAGAALIYVRERRTRDLLAAMGVAGSRVRLAPDVAFSLPALPPDAALAAEGIDAAARRGPLVGLSVSCLAERLGGAARAHAYMNAMLRLCHHLHRRYDATLLLVPHVIGPPERGPDDRSTARRLRARAGAPPWMHLVTRDHDPSTLKGIIARCDALVAARMHAAIAGLSSGVPTIPVAWSHKYHGLMEEIGLGEFVWDQRRDPPEALPGLFDRLWACREPVRRRLLVYTAQARRDVGEIVRVLAALIDAAPRRRPPWP